MHDKWHAHIEHILQDHAQRSHRFEILNYQPIIHYCNHQMNTSHKMRLSRYGVMDWMNDDYDEMEWIPHTLPILNKYLSL